MDLGESMPELVYPHVTDGLEDHGGDEPHTARQELGRRGFLRHGAVAGLLAGTILPGALRRVWASSASAGEASTCGPVFPGFGGTCPRFDVFDEHTFETLVAFAEQIVPTDQDPGSTDLCSASLVEAIAVDDTATANLITAGLAALDQSSEILRGAKFKDLDFDDQTHVLVEVEAGQAPGSAWNSRFFRKFLRQRGGPLTRELERLLRRLRRMSPAPHMMAGVWPGECSGSVAAQAQQTFFSTLRTLSKLGFVLNFPENVVRNPDGTPIFADPQHLISDPDDDSTQTGWTIVGFHEIDWTVEKLMWEWQAGFRVIGFNGVPVLDTGHPLTDQERLAARDALWALSDQGMA